jgi:hypothetical protein
MPVQATRAPTTNLFVLEDLEDVSRTSLQRLCRGGEEVDQQLVDALGLVVMHPVRRVGQALHAVEVGHVVAVGLGEVGAEVGIALTPDHERRR